jgi:hypothetical protein
MARPAAGMICEIFALARIMPRNSHSADGT